MKVHGINPGDRIFFDLQEWKGDVTYFTEYSRVVDRVSVNPLNGSVGYVVSVKDCEDYKIPAEEVKRVVFSNPPQLKLFHSSSALIIKTK